MVSLNNVDVLSFRARRQMLTLETKGRGQDGTIAVLRVAQPGVGHSAIRWLSVRMDPPDHESFFAMRRRGDIPRARLLGGNLGCVLQEDLRLYLDACAIEPPYSLSSAAERILSILNKGAPATTDELKASLHLHGKDLRDALAELGRCQFVMDAPWGTWWLIDHGEQGPAEPGSERHLAAQVEVTRRFLSNYGPATLQEIRDWSGWIASQVKKVIQRLRDDSIVTPCVIDSFLEERYVLTSDIPRIESANPTQSFITILDCLDPFVRTQKTALAHRFGFGTSLQARWYYVMVNGELLGALNTYYKEHILWVTAMLLDGEVLADEELTQGVFQEIRRVRNGQPIRIDSLNGAPVDFGVNSEILEEQGFSFQDGAAWSST
jgi:hypothetical protein